MEPTGGHDDDHGRGGRTGGRRRPSPAVYRRRRLAVTILALLVAGALIVGAMALAGAFARGSDASAGGSPTQDPTGAPATPAPASEGPAGATGPATAAPTASPGPTAPPSPSASAQPSASSENACDPDDVVVEAGTDRSDYGPDDTVLLSLVVRNEGDTACTANVGTSQMEFLVTSGDERVFSSIDCQQASQDLERTIEPGADQRAEFEWSRNRSMPGCTPVEEEPGAGQYTVTTKLGLRSSSPVDFTLQ
ncbi:hypothetical protein [Arthrobacter sp. MDT1-65]